MVPPKCHSSDYDGNGNDDCFMLPPTPKHTLTLTHTRMHVRTHYYYCNLMLALAFPLRFVFSSPTFLPVRLTLR